MDIRNNTRSQVSFFSSSKQVRELITTALRATVMLVRALRIHVMDIQERTQDFINELLWFKLKYDVSRYLSDRATSNWREFEAEQHEDYPIKGCGLIADSTLLQEWTFENESLLHLDEDLAPEETGSEIDSFPRDTVSIVYVFSLLEAYGNDVCDELNSSYRRERQAWHHDVYGNANLSDTPVKAKMLDNFCRPFGFDKSKVPEPIVAALVELKRQRNSIVHEIEHASEFELFFRCTVAIACCIYCCWGGAASELKIYPWYDFYEKYKP